MSSHATRTVLLIAATVLSITAFAAGGPAVAGKGGVSKSTTGAGPASRDTSTGRTDIKPDRPVRQTGGYQPRPKAYEPKPSSAFCKQHGCRPGQHRPGHTGSTHY
jgi:hypothetical protein